MTEIVDPETPPSDDEWESILHGTGDELSVSSILGTVPFSEFATQITEQGRSIRQMFAPVLATDSQ